MPKKQSEECVFVNSALKLQCHIDKIHSYRLLFGDFAHWVAFCQIQQALKRSRLGDEAQKIAVILKRLEKGTAKSSTMTSVARKVTT